MALPRNSFLAGVLVFAGLASPAIAGSPDDNYIYNYMTHSDTITIGLGDAPTSNIIIQHPTPWPSYINNTKIKTSAEQGVIALEQLMLNSAAQSSSTSTTTSAGGGAATGSATTTMSPSPSSN